MEILAPAFADYRAMGNDYNAAELHFLHDLQCGQRLAEAHFGVPEHIVLLFE